MKEELPPGCVCNIEGHGNRWVVEIRGFNPPFWKTLEISEDEAEKILREKDELVEELRKVREKIHEKNVEFMKSVWERME